ncbi:MAG: AAA family ATPase [Gemmatimonadaceae bacterium]
MRSLRDELDDAAARVEPASSNNSGTHDPPRNGPSPPRRPTLRLLDVDLMLTTEPEPVPWLAEPLLARGAVTMLAGREGQGKSMLALALAAALGHGATIAGIACETGQVLVVDAENGEREVHRRVRGLGVKPGTLAYVEAEGFNLVKEYEQVDTLAVEHRPDLLVLDSLRSLAPALDENDSAQAEQVLAPLRALARRHNCAVLLLAHAGKAGHEYRGSTALGAGIEFGFTLAREDLDPEKRTRRKLTCWKSRWAPEPETRWITLEARGGCVLIGEAEPYAGADAGPSQGERRAELLGQLAAEHGPIAWQDLAGLAQLSPTAGATKQARALAEEKGWLVKVAHGRYAAPSEESGRSGPSDGPLAGERSVRPEPLGPADGRTIEETS